MISYMNVLFVAFAAVQLATPNVQSLRPGELTVSIKNTEGKPVPGASILILPSAQEFWDVRSCGCLTGPDGIAQFQNVPDGSFAATVLAPEPASGGAGLYFFIRDTDLTALPPKFLDT
jgi:hypothetical protein